MSPIVESGSASGGGSEEEKDKEGRLDCSIQALLFPL